MTDQPTPANWYADPSGRHQYRYWDGSSWTEHVSTNGQQFVDPLQPAFGDTVDRVTTVGSHPSPQDVQAMVQGDGRTGAGIPASAETSVGSGTIWTEPVLVVTQKAKLIEVNNQYSVFDQHGRQLAFVNQVGQSAAKKVIRVLTSLDQYMTHKLEITDANGQVQLRLTRPRSSSSQQSSWKAPMGPRSARSSRTTPWARSTSHSNPTGRSLARSMPRTGELGTSTSATSTM